MSSHYSPRHAERSRFDFRRLPTEFARGWAAHEGVSVHWYALTGTQGMDQRKDNFKSLCGASRLIRQELSIDDGKGHCVACLRMLGDQA